MSNQPDDTSAQTDGAPASAPAEGTANPNAQSEPDSKTAEETKGITFDSFNEDERKFLESNGVSDLTSADDIKKLINQASTAKSASAKAGNDKKALEDQVKELTGKLNGTPNPTTEESAAPKEEEAPANPVVDASPKPQAGSLDELTATNIMLAHKNMFPEIEEDIFQGDIYAEYVKLTRDNTLSKFSDLTEFVKGKAKVAKLQAKLKEYETSDADEAPVAKPESITAGKITVAQAKSIILEGDEANEHYAEAKKILKEQTRAAY